LKKGSKDIEKDVQEMPGKRLRTNKRTKHSGPLSISPSPPLYKLSGTVGAAYKHAISDDNRKSICIKLTEIHRRYEQAKLDVSHPENRPRESEHGVPLGGDIIFCSIFTEIIDQVNNAYHHSRSSPRVRGEIATGSTGLQ
jgi:hypothetical protein